MSARLALLLMALGAFLAKPACWAEEPRGFFASDLHWKGIYADRASEPKVVYCLLGRSQYSSPVSADVEQVVFAWLAAHPSARAVPVWSFTPAERKDLEARQTWVWVVAGDANLCLDLVAKGCCPATTMAVPVGQTPDLPGSEVDAFVAAAAKAEEAARVAHAGIWGTPEAIEEVALDRAEALKKEMKYADAVSAFQEAMKAGADPESCWMSIAECREAGGEYLAALAAYDEAISAGGIAAISARAHCMSRTEGPAVAAAWMKTLVEKAPKDEDKAVLWLLLGVFHMEEKRWSEALDPLATSAQLRCDAHGFRFDLHGELILDEAARRSEDDFLAPVDALDRVARCRVWTNELDAAFLAATQAVSLMRQSKRVAGRAAADEVEAGDCAGRAIRAIVLARQGKLDEARKEAALARLLATRSKSPADREAAEQAEKALARPGK